MSRSIFILTDYKGFFGFKQKSHIYRGGMDVERLLYLFQQNGFKAKSICFSQINLNELLKEQPVILYTSSEDKNGFYKSFIEDIIYNLEESGIIVLPAFKYLRAHNNKVAMELLRERSDYELIKSIHSQIFGTIQELIQNADSVSFPAVLKPASGAMSKGVEKAENVDELIRKASRIARTPDVFYNLKELLRKLKYRNRYIRESFHRNKFIVQNLIPGLSNDWKVLVYGNKCYVLFRGNRDNDFRASGSGKFEYRKDVPEGMLDFSLSVKTHFNVPHISLDIGHDGKRFHLIEFQFLYFGTTTIEKSNFYFERSNNVWVLKEGKSILEDIYADSIMKYIDREN